MQCIAGDLLGAEVLAGERANEIADSARRNAIAVLTGRASFSDLKTEKIYFNIKAFKKKSPNCG